MSRDVIRDHSNPEIEQLLSVEANGDTNVRLQPNERLTVNDLCLQDGVSSSLQDRSTVLNHNVEESSSCSTAAVTPSSVVANRDENNDNPPPYSSIPPPYYTVTALDHTDWPHELFSFGNATDETSRMQIPLTPFQTYLTPTTTLHPEGIDDQYPSYQMPLMPYQFFKFGYNRNSFIQRERMEVEAAEKINDRKIRRWSVIFMSVAVIIFLMVLSSLVRFIVEKGWWRR